MSTRLCALCLTLYASASLAQSALPAFNLERLALNPGGQHTWLADTGDGLPQGHLRVSLLGHYQHAPLVFTVNGQARGALVAGRAGAVLAAAWGALPFLEVGVVAPVVVSQWGDDLSSRGFAAPAAPALGSPTLQARFTVLREADGQPVDLSASLGVVLPAGSGDALAREPGLGLAAAPRLGLGRTLGLVRVGAELGAVLREGVVLSPAAVDIADELGSQLNGALVVSMAGPLLRGELAVRGTAPLTRSPGSVELLAGVRVPLLDGQLELSALGGPGLGKTPGTPAFRLLAGLTWTPKWPAAAASQAPVRPEAESQETATARDAAQAQDPADAQGVSPSGLTLEPLKSKKK